MGFVDVLDMMDDDCNTNRFSIDNVENIPVLILKCEDCNAIFKINLDSMNPNNKIVCFKCQNEENFSIVSDNYNYCNNCGKKICDTDYYIKDQDENIFCDHSCEEEYLETINLVELEDEQIIEVE